jgi:hypothetical protein
MVPVLLATVAGWSACLLGDLIAVVRVCAAARRMRRGFAARRAGVDYGVGPSEWVRPVPASSPYRAQDSLEIQAVGSPRAAAALLGETFCIKAFAALILPALVATCDVHPWAQCCRGRDLGTTKTACDSLRQATVTWRTLHPGEDCPTVKQLRQDNALERNFVTKDAWGNPFKLTCQSDQIVCTTAGPDKREGTEDDVIRPQPEATIETPAR